MSKFKRPESLSRRDGLKSGAAALMLSMSAGRALAQRVADAPPAQSTDSKKNPQDVSALPDLSNHLTVAVSINGKGPYRFVVDTGADRTIVAADVAASLGLPTSRQVMVEGIVKTIPATTVDIENLTVGPIALDNLRLPILPRALLGADGYLGIDAVDGYSVTFDFVGNFLRLERSEFDHRANIMLTSSTHVAAEGSFGHLKTLNCSVDGVPATAFLDSGAEVTIANSELARALTARDPGHKYLASLPLTGVTGGLVYGDVLSIEKVRLRTLTFSIPEIVIADLQIFNIWGLKDTPALLIGMNYLKKFARVTVDYGVKEFRFDLAGLTMAGRA